MYPCLLTGLQRVIFLSTSEPSRMPCCCPGCSQPSPLGLIFTASIPCQDSALEFVASSCPLGFRSHFQTGPHSWNLPFRANIIPDLSQRSSPPGFTRFWLIRTFQRFQKAFSLDKEGQDWVHRFPIWKVTSLSDSFTVPVLRFHCSISLIEIHGRICTSNT